MSTHKPIRTDFGYECRYYPESNTFMWASHNGIQLSCSRKGMTLLANSPLHYSLDSFRKLLLLVESVHRQLGLSDDTVSGGLWFDGEFWPWGWVENGKPGAV